MRVRVADGTQVHHDGLTYDAGQVLEVDDATAVPWLASEWVTPAVESKPVRKAATTRKASS